MTDIPARQKLRAGTLAAWSTSNPILLAGEPVFEVDSKVLRVGDGVSTFLMLPQFKTSAALDDVYQPKAETLTSLSGLTLSAGKMLYATGANTLAMFDSVSFGRGLMNLADQAAGRTYFGLLGAATKGVSNDPDFAVQDTALTERRTINDRFGVANAPGTKTALNASGAAPIYACRAWVNFNGTGTVAIRAAGNVSSITDNGVGDYTINFTAAMPDANYVVLAAGNSANPVNIGVSEDVKIMTGGLAGTPTLKTANAVRLLAGNAGPIDFSEISVAIFG